MQKYRAVPWFMLLSEICHSCFYLGQNMRNNLQYVLVPTHGNRRTCSVFKLILGFFVI